MKVKLQLNQMFLMALLSVLWMDVEAQVLAFPGAEGFGRHTTGGRGGVVYEVTNLNDSGVGSLRDAVNKSGARTIVFRVSGQIELMTPLQIQNGNLTIAGQTAPGGGIVVSGQQTTIDASNVIIRFVRFRLGDSNEVEADAVSSRFGENIIIDHCTFSWGVDEVMSMYRNKNTTFQWNIVAESMNRSAHSKGDHGYGGIWGGASASFHHNLITHHKSRNPRFNGARYEGNWNELVDFRNNVIYNWGDNSIYGAEPSEVDGNKANYNMVNNYFKYGPATGGGSKRYRIISPDNQSTGDAGYSLFYIEGNFTFGYPEVSQDNWNGGVQGINEDIMEEVRMNEPFDFHMETDHTAKEAFEYVLRNAGVTFPYRDEVDQRIVEEVATGTAKYGGASYGNGIIDSQEDVGGYPELPSGTAPTDTDKDGMPDEWEADNGFDLNNAADGSEDADLDGYTNLEEYLNGLVESTLVSNITYMAQPAGLTLSVDQIVQNSARVSWNPLENTNAEVVLERALDKDGTPGEFEVIATMSADTTFHEYLELDENSRVYYRIKAVEGDMESLYSNVVNSFVAPSNVTGIFNRQNRFMIYPNPLEEGRNELKVSGDNISTILITDISGRTIKRIDSVPGTGLTIKTANWKPGYYILKTQFLNGTVQSSKIIKR